MGGACSKKSNASNKNSNPHISSTQQVKERVEKKELQEANLKQQARESFLYAKNDVGDEFYDGIPRYPSSSIKSRSIRRQAAVAKVSEVSSRLSRAGTLGLGKAVEALDTLGSSMTNLNPNIFTSSVATKGNELGILAFEVANTVVKGSNLMQSLSIRSVSYLKEEVLPSEGVQNLISKDMDELLRIVAADKREELKIFSGEVVRFGNRCKDSQWHNLDRYFEKISREQTPRKGLREEAKSIMEFLTILVQYTAELYQELQILDKMEQECQQREDAEASNHKGESLRTEIKNQRKQIRNVKKKSLWSRSLEEVMEKFVDIVHFLILEIGNAYGSFDDSVQDEESVSNPERLGPAGLSLHYANVVMQIDSLVARSGSLPPDNELTITEIKDVMEKTLQWLVPMSINTAKAHHGFGWVGEWASIGSEPNRKSAAAAADIIRIETLHHADKEKTEACILEQVLWLHHLVRKTKSASGGGSTLGQKLNQKQKQELPNAPELSAPVTDAPLLTTNDPTILQEESEKKQILEKRKSQDFNSVDTKLRDDRMSKSNGHSPMENEDSTTVRSDPSGLLITDVGIDKENESDAID
ncbi:hypothetical protein OIU77_016553 [Salix suchowensis]|uniref:Uncharacterized protein n=1 Tax=Salix suchowensis TaxID=1278906 RepID=A0ABQ8ZL09_9ROSI|nr:hypothetical protein OIU77_016553 [Salix suchowensis]